MLPWLIDHDKVDIFKAGQESGLGFSFVATMQDILEMEQLLARDYFVKLDHPVAGQLTYPGAPISCEPDAVAWVFRRAPLCCEHTASALADWLGTRCRAAGSDLAVHAASSPGTLRQSRMLG